MFTRLQQLFFTNNSFIYLPVFCIPKNYMPLFDEKARQIDDSMSGKDFLIHES